MKNRTKSVFSFLKVFSIILVFTLSTNLNAATLKASTAISSDLNVSSLSFILSPFSLTTMATIGDYPNRVKDRTGYNNDRPSRSKDHGTRRGCCNGTCGGGDEGDEPEEIPLDGGLSFLVLGAAAFGIRKLRKEKNDKI
ncbi:hypothetical protein KO493_03850 [Tamlana agarivorans]|uniref:Uncharacterized protein n=1 Tax=Pseudotamlana agarivorans TaxID=481183 RepID=A0ACC5U695_9FLAO|nr:hypothetical protein [Tamlana agarivorans]MBU2949827.1 hypothetical protein [Tamlana agarivorans]